MEVTIDLRAGPSHLERVTKRQIEKNIDALQRAIDGKSLASDFVLLQDTKSVLEAIKAKLPSA